MDALGCIIITGLGLLTERWSALSYIVSLPRVQRKEDELRIKHVKHSTNRNIAFNSRDFVKSAWADIERFKEQKNHDLKEALISYAVMQISMCKKVRLACERPG